MQAIYLIMILSTLQPLHVNKDWISTQLAFVLAKIDCSEHNNAYI